MMRERLEAKGISSRRIVEIPNWATGTQGLITGVDNKLCVEW